MAAKDADKASKTASLREIAAHLGQANQIAAAQMNIEHEQLRLDQRKLAALEQLVDMVRNSQQAGAAAVHGGNETIREVIMPILEMLSAPKERRRAEPNELPKALPVTHERSGTRVTQEMD